MYLAAMGRLDEAINEARRAQTLDALSPIVNTDLGWCLLYAGRGSEAVDQFRRTLEIDPKYVSARWGLGASYAQQRAFNDAVAELKQAVTLSEGSPLVLGHLGYVYGLGGMPADAKRPLAELNTLSARQYVPSTAFALVYAGLGDKAQRARVARPRRRRARFLAGVPGRRARGSRACAPSRDMNRCGAIQLPDRRPALAEYAPASVRRGR